MPLLLLPATAVGRLVLVGVLTLVLLPAVVWGASMVGQREALTRRRGAFLLSMLLVVLVGLWWWVLQTRVVVAGWHTVVH